MKGLTTFLLVMQMAGATAMSAMANKPVKVKVSQDAFVQGGNTANEPMGVTESGELRIMKSGGTDKYSRTSYLQFNLKKVEDFTSVDLNICVKVYESKEDASAEFEMQVYACDDNKWSESSLAFNNKPEKGDLLATQTMGVNEKNEWVKISLPADKVKQLLKKSKKGKITLVLSNDNFNKTSAIVISKERLWSNGTPANREAFLQFK
ncbi:DNRLRE domain-containing protein [Carboxylicivirga mesophila]|uniref:DNRLRE domain-containing protein n=1 Tax=Carboxylicivirga mesophila TaxID=1166478 RepID=A0ABS5KDH9_9BACT|nr:DNRLRE domain-containing protein [Carboxylicivirga mesophila]MBS2213090.1 DNRLRE domain-containing protein [Carboxylicivirga mesophila]